MYTLLIVDDEEIEREGMAQLISWEKYGYKLVGTARNGAEGLEKIDQLHPDIVIVDIKMPVMNGIEMIRQGQAAYPDTAYVVLSGYGDYEYTSQAMELGVRHYILKPCDDAKIMPVLATTPRSCRCWTAPSRNWKRGGARRPKTRKTSGRRGCSNPLRVSRCSVTCCWAAHSRGQAPVPWWRNWAAASGR